MLVAVILAFGLLSQTCGRKKSERAASSNADEAEPEATPVGHAAPSPAQESDQDKGRPEGPRKEESRSGSTPLIVSAAWLSKRLGVEKEMVVLDISRPASFAAGHIPYSRRVSLELFNQDRKGLKLEMITDRQRVQKTLRALGIDQGSHVVLVFRGRKKKAVFMATRVFMTLHGFGVKTSILNGGLPAWKRAGYALTRDSPAHFLGNMTMKPFDTRLLIRMEEIPRSKDLFDVRTAVFFTGRKKENVSRAGTIPRARNLPFEELLNDDLTFKSPGDLAAVFKEHKVGDGAVFFCDVGGTGTIAWFAARFLGRNARLYDGSMNEWASVKTNPVVNGRIPKTRP